MKIVNIEQNSKDWYTWRGKGLGASDAAVIMGVSKWTTPFELWTYVTGVCTRPEPNRFAEAAMQRGHDLEPQAREIANKQIGKVFSPLCVEDTDRPHARASLDGYCGLFSPDSAMQLYVVAGGEILEIKCPGKVAHAKALKGEVPAEYYAQVQQQLYVSQASKAWYFSWDGESAYGAVIEVLPDLEYQTRLVAALDAFWGRVQSMVPPACTGKDIDKLVSRLTAEQARVTNTLKALEMAASALEVA